MEQTISFTLNGKPASVTADAERMLLSYLMVLRPGRAVRLPRGGMMLSLCMCHGCPTRDRRLRK